MATIDASGTTICTYNAANRLIDVDGVPYTWDDRGNLTHDGVFTYTYDAAGRLVRAVSITATVQYTYTAEGLRTAQDVDGEVTTFAWDWVTAVPELLSDDEALYLVGHDTLGWEDDGTWTYIVPDALGSVRQETDAHGAVVAVREWTPYGVELSAARDGLGYAGEWYDPDLGLQYLRAMVYVTGGRPHSDGPLGWQLLSASDRKSIPLCPRRPHQSGGSHWTICHW